MTTLTTPTISSALHVRRLPAWAIAVTAAGGVALSVALFSGLGLLGGGPVLTAVGAVVLFLVGLSVVSTVVEGGRAARNRVATALVYSAFVLALLPLVSVVATLFGKGTGRLDADFFNHSMRNITSLDANGGATAVTRATGDRSASRNPRSTPYVSNGVTRAASVAVVTTGCAPSTPATRPANSFAP